MNVESVIDETVSIIKLELSSLKPLTPEQTKLLRGLCTFKEGDEDYEFGELFFNDTYIVSTDINDSEHLIDRCFGEGKGDIVVKFLAFNTLIFAFNYSKMESIKKILQGGSE